MIRIAFLIDTISSNMAGTEKQLLNIIDRIDDNEFKITIICLHESPWLKDNKLSVSVENLGYSGLLKSGVIGVIRTLAEIIDRDRIDIVQTFFEESIFIGLLGKVLSKHKPVIISSRRDLGLGEDEPFYHRFFKNIRPLVMKYYDGVIVNAEAIKSYVIEYENVPESKITVIPNGLDLPAEIVESPVLFKDYPDSIWVGIVANLKPIKRIDLLIKAIAIAVKMKEGCLLRAVILGSGRLMPELENLANELGVSDRIHFAGSTSFVEAYLKNIDIGVLCSNKEGLSNAILEYMASGLPVIATGVGGNSELVDDSNGVCIPPDDPAALAEGLLKLTGSRELRVQMGARSLQKIKECYTWDIIVPQWSEYYRSLAG